MQGRLFKVYCPKCRTMLETDSRTIEGTWSGRLRTIGSNTGRLVSNAGRLDPRSGQPLMSAIPVNLAPIAEA